MFVHSVFFWLKDSLNPDQTDTFRRGLESLHEIPALRQFHVGTPAATDRPIIDRSYTFALLTVFDDQAGHDAYQEHPIHTAFAQTFQPFWTKVVIYDAE
jgi:hypothetical protein